MSSSTVTPTAAPDAVSEATCTCGAAAPVALAAERGRRLATLDRAVGSGQVTRAEAAERRVQLLAR